MKKLFVLLGVSFLLLSCGKKVTNEGTASLENGKKEKVEVPFTCVGCVENIATAAELDTLMQTVSTHVKGMMNYPLSYVPTKLSFGIEPIDSLIAFSTNQPIPNLQLVSYTMSYIAQNAYGTEKEDNVEGTLYLSNGRVIDITKEAKLPDVTLTMDDDGYYSPSRDLTIYGLDDENAYIKLSPFYNNKKQLCLLVSCSLSCIDEGDRLIISFAGDDSDNHVVLENIKDFNCDGQAYFRILSEEAIAKLASNKMLVLSLFHDRSKVTCAVSANKADYFQQIVKLSPAQAQQ